MYLHQVCPLHLALLFSDRDLSLSPCLFPIQTVWVSKQRGKVRGQTGMREPRVDWAGVIPIALKVISTKLQP